MKIAIAARNPDNEIVGIGSIGVGDKETITRAEVQMRNPADPVAPGWTVTLQFDPPMSRATKAPEKTTQVIAMAIRGAAHIVAQEIIDRPHEYEQETE